MISTGKVRRKDYLLMDVVKKGIQTMRRSLASFNNGLEVTYYLEGTELVVYFEKPNNAGTDFDTATYIYPKKELNSSSEEFADEVTPYINKFSVVFDDLWEELLAEVGLHIVSLENTPENRTVANVAESMAIENMYPSESFLRELLKVANGEKSSEQLIQEVIEKHTNN